MRSKGSGAELERIRKLAVKAVLAGHKQKDVAEIFDVHFKTLSSWVCSYRIDPDSLQARPNTGRTPQLTAENLVHLEELLVLGPRNHGWKTDIWKNERHFFRSGPKKSKTHTTKNSNAIFRNHVEQAHFLK